MIRKIDWYILKKFILSFVVSMLLFTAIAIAVDSSEKATQFSNSGLSTWQIVTQYYFGFIPHIWGLLYPLFVFLAVIYFTSKMALRSEVIAIIGSGTSFNRWLRPYFIGAVFFAAVLWYANHYLIPTANDIRGTFEQRYLGKDGYYPSSDQSCYNCFYKRIDSNTYVGMKYYDTATKSAHPFFMQRVQNSRVVYNLRAERIEWDTAQNNWRLVNVVERHVDSMGERLVQQPVMNIRMNLKPGELKKDSYVKDKLTTPELEAYIQLEEIRATQGLNPMKVELYRRSATPFTVILLTLTGAIIAGRKTRGGSGLHIAIGIIIASTMILADRFSTVFATNANFHPVLAAWTPNVIFSFVALFLYVKAPK